VVALSASRKFPLTVPHHVMPVSKLEKGSLKAANIMTVCANHHRQLHYGGVKVAITETDFELELDGKQIKIRRPQV
jgi:predicted HNH restriction endonuclease